jgi:hypothetical protein
MTATHDIADLDFHQVTAAQLAVDGLVKEGTVTQPLMLIEIKADGPNITQLQRSFRPDICPVFQGRRACAAGSRYEWPIVRLLLAMMAAVRIRLLRSRRPML